MASYFQFQYGFVHLETAAICWIELGSCHGARTLISEGALPSTLLHIPFNGGVVLPRCSSLVGGAFRGSSARTAGTVFFKCGVGDRAATSGQALGVLSALLGGLSTAHCYTVPLEIADTVSMWLQGKQSCGCLPVWVAIPAAPLPASYVSCPPCAPQTRYIFRRRSCRHPK